MKTLYERNNVDFSIYTINGKDDIWMRIGEYAMNIEVTDEDNPYGRRVFGKGYINSNLRKLIDRKWNCTEEEGGFKSE